MHFPTVTGANLSGRRFTLPADLEGELNLLQVAFLQQHQASVDTWAPLLNILARRHPAFRFYELPTIRPLGWVQQLIVDNGMRMGIPDRAVRDRTITLYLDVQRFVTALGIASTGSIHSLLVDRSGAILWRAEGDYTLARGDDITRRVAELSEARAAA